MDLLDIVILALLVVSAFSGFRRGLTWVGPSLAGLLAGLLVGAVAAPPIARALTHNLDVQPLIAIGFFLAISLIIQGIGTGIGFQVRVRTLRTRFAPATHCWVPSSPCSACWRPPGTWGSCSRRARG